MTERDPALGALVEALREVHAKKQQLLVVTGAGVSLASGIPTFRGTDPDAVWKRDVTELGTYEYFREDPAGSWGWYLTRFAGLAKAKPNAGHHALVALERWQLAGGGDYLLVTQNIDTLHEDAGSRAMIKVHGSSDRFRCARVGCVDGAPSGSIPRRDVDLGPFLENPVEANVPKCKRCGDYLRMHVLWFDEYYHAHEGYRFLDAERAAKRTASLVLFAGTSFSVGVTDMITRAASFREVPIFNLDPTPRTTHPAITNVPMASELALPAVCEALGVAQPS